MTPKEDSDWVDVNDESSIEDEEQESSDDDEDDDGEEVDGDWWQEVVVGAWKQHAVAILVAFAAAIYSHGKLLSMPFSGDHHHHHHVHTYNRTSGIRFCPSLVQREKDGFLEPMDFRVSLDLVSVMERHYHADYLQDNDYSQPTDPSVALNLHNPEYTCMKELETMTTQSYIKGYAMAYKSPSVSDIYAHDKTTLPVALTFTGFAAKFINLSPKPILLHWDGKGGHKDSARLVAEIAPFEAVGTATTPGQSFHVSPILDATHALERWVLTADSALVVYQEPEINVEKLNSRNEMKYKMQLLNLAYAKDYLVKTGRPWLAAFPRPRPLHYMHSAQYLEQKHVVSLENQRFQMEVASVQPRVFVIENFLSNTEAQHLIQLGQQEGLRASTVHSGDTGGEAMSDVNTRSSTNAWIERDASATVDSIYQRAADLMKIDQSLLRHNSRLHKKVATHHSIAESLQLVHYGIDEEYTPHHDFVYPSMINRYQPTRFATLLMYLNDEGLEGGETVFPRALNAEFHDGITIKPKMGRAVLFYNVLPDGNVDDASQHGSKPVTKGDKWLANMWVWDPIID